MSVGGRGQGEAGQLSGGEGVPGGCGQGAEQHGGYPIVIPNRALEQTLAKMPVPWAGLAPWPLAPPPPPEPAYPASPAFPPLSCPFASRVVYQDGFYGAEIYVSVAAGGKGDRWPIRDWDLPSLHLSWGPDPVDGVGDSGWPSHPKHTGVCWSTPSPVQRGPGRPGAGIGPCTLGI